MAVAYDNSVGINDFSVTNTTTGSFLISGSNRAAVVSVGWFGTVNTVVGNVGGVSMSAIAGATATNGTSLITAYQVIAPPVGSQTAFVQWATVSSVGVSVITATGVNQTTPFNGGVGVNGGFAASVGSSIASTSGDLTTSGMFQDSGDSLQTSNQTQKTTQFCCADIGPGTGTVTHTWSHVITNVIFAGANFVAISVGDNVPADDDGASFQIVQAR